MAPGRFKMAPRTVQILANRFKKCQTVSKSVRKRQKCKKTQCFWRASKRSKRVKKWSRVKTCQNVSKSVKKVSKKCQKSVKNVSQRVKNSARSNVSCQNVSENHFFATFCDTHFCLLGFGMLHVSLPACMIT